MNDGEDWSDEWPKKEGWYWTFSSYPNCPPTLSACYVWLAGSGKGQHFIYQQDGEMMYESEADRLDRIIYWKRVDDPIIDRRIECNLVTRYVRAALVTHLKHKSFFYYEEEEQIVPDVERAVVPNLIPMGGFCHIQPEKLKFLSLVGKKQMDGEFWLTTFQDQCLRKNYRIAVEKTGLYTVLRK